MKDLENWLIGESRNICDVRKFIIDMADSELPILIHGETGTGKEIVAEALHKYSGKKNRVVFNCANFTETLSDSQLFGHKKGAYTGAINDQKGKFELADGGILFLDEIGDMPLYAQAKILRAVETGEIEPLGGKEVKVKVNLICATNKDLDDMVKKGKFREDLYYRLCNVKCEIKPLRERVEDIMPLTAHFINTYLREKEYKGDITVQKGFLNQLLFYGWEGNVRELKRDIENILYLAVKDESTVLSYKALSPKINNFIQKKAIVKTMNGDKEEWYFDNEFWDNATDIATIKLNEIKNYCNPKVKSMRQSKMPHIVISPKCHYQQFVKCFKDLQEAESTFKNMIKDDCKKILDKFENKTEAARKTGFKKGTFMDKATENRRNKHETTENRRFPCCI